MITPNELLINGRLKAPILTALRTALIAQAYFETMKPIYEDVCDTVLKIHQPLVDASDFNRRTFGDIGSPITQINDLYRANDDQAKAIYRDIKQKLALKGFTTSNSNYCAFAVAESTLREAERELVNVMQPYTNITNAMLCTTDKRHKFINLTLNCLVPLATQAGQGLNALTTN